MAGVLGAGAAGREVARRTDGETFVLRARERVRPPARPANAGDRLTLVAELLDADGAHAGELFGAAFALRGPEEPSGSQRLEQHTFELPDGTVVGAGTLGLLEGTFAVLGGTGRYAGARGSYLVRQAPGEDAELVFTLLA